MMSPKQAAVQLATYERRAAADGSFSTRFNGTRFEVRADGEVSYTWGRGRVEKHVAINVVRTFATEDSHERR